MGQNKRPDKKGDLSVVLQTITILISKPLNLGFMILGIVIIYTSIISIINNEPIYGSGQSGIYISLMFIALGVFLVLYCGYQVFFVKIGKQLTKLGKGDPNANKQTKDKND